MRTATDIPVVLAFVVSVHPWHCHAWTPSLSLSSSPLPQHYYSTGIRHTRVVPQHQSKPRSHWHRRREWARSAQNDDGGDDEEEPIEEESSFNIDGYGVTTKTRKQLIFDEATGRFFETSLEPPEQEEIVTSSYTSDYVDDLSSMNRNVIIDYNTTKYAVTDMIPTEELFASRRQRQQQQTPPPPSSSSSSSSRPPTTSSCTTTSDVLEMECQKQECGIIVVKEEVDDDDDEQQLDDASLLVGVGRVDSVIRDCYDAWNRRDMVVATDCFDDQGFSYQDGQYLGCITKKEELERHFTLQAGMLPLNSQLVVDQIAVDPTTGNIGTQWHAEDSDGASTVSYTKGISFYTTNTQTGKIVSGFRVSEMLVKPSKQASDALVSLVARFLETTPISDPAAASFASNKASPSSPPPPLPSPPQKSIIETYFEAWNRRDMESALDCFVENCVYQTEDPVFVDTFQGKAALRKHLEQNANTLPASCRIVLDGIAMDPTNGTIGTTWHLKVGGVPITNLRGCSMYTIDAATGLLTSGLDITEAPVKIPRMAMSVLSFPAKWFLFGTPSSFS